MSKIYSKLKEPLYSQIDLDDLISYYKNSSEHIASRKWWPVTLAALIAFPVWSETVGVLLSDYSRIEMKLAMAFTLLIASLSITFLLTSIKKLLETILLNSSSDQNQFAEIIRLVKISRSLERT